MRRTNRSRGARTRVVYCRRFWHAKAKRWIYAAPGKAFRFEVEDKQLGLPLN